MDVLSSMSTITGYQAVLLAARTSPRMFPLLMTAAGTLSAARVLVLGAGVAGLQAIATARRLGAVVQAYDVRPVVREQVESLGATFVSFNGEESGATAAAMPRSNRRRSIRGRSEMLADALRDVDVAITTALVLGRRAPTLITAAAVAGMRPGSVIVDLAAERGGELRAERAGRDRGSPRRVDRGAARSGVGRARPREPDVRPQRIDIPAPHRHARRIGARCGDEIFRETLVTPAAFAPSGGAPADAAPVAGA